jgi:catechol 2,3-dioxygenase-like lactoylglutathione lyase family enzyme
VATLTGISPVLLVSDLKRSVAYYRDRLGFRCDVFGEPPDFATAERDQPMILLALCDEPARIVPNWRIVGQGLERLHPCRRRRERLCGGASARRGLDYTLSDAPSGFREFGVQDPDCYDIALGQPL